MSFPAANALVFGCWRWRKDQATEDESHYIELIPATLWSGLARLVWRSQRPSLRSVHPYSASLLGSHWASRCLFQPRESAALIRSTLASNPPSSVPSQMPCQYKNSRSRASCTTQSKPFSRFSPVIALQGMTIHRCVRMCSRSSNCVASCSIIPPATSVLFRNTSRLDPDNRFMLSMMRQAEWSSNVPPRAADL